METLERKSNRMIKTNLKQDDYLVANKGLNK